LNEFGTHEVQGLYDLESYFIALAGLVVLAIVMGLFMFLSIKTVIKSR
jgi:hypothetical protein